MLKLPEERNYSPSCFVVCSFVSLFPNFFGTRGASPGNSGYYFFQLVVQSMIPSSWDIIYVPRYVSLKITQTNF